MSFNANKIVSFNIDDTNYCFNSLKNNPTLSSIFLIPFLGWMKTMHDTYGCVFTCPVFYLLIFGGSLADVPDTWKAEFTANANWLRFTFHSYSVNHTYPSVEVGTGWQGESFITTRNLFDDYVTTRTEIIRICGSGSWHDESSVHHYMHGRKAEMEQIAAYTGNNKVWMSYPVAQRSYAYEYYFLCSTHPEVRAGFDTKGYYTDTSNDFLFVPLGYFPDNSATTPFSAANFPDIHKNVFVAISHEDAIIGSGGGDIKARFVEVAIWANSNGYTWQYPTYDYIKTAYGLNTPFKTLVGAPLLFKTLSGETLLPQPWH